MAEKNQVDALAKALEILNLFSEDYPELGISEISRLTGLYKSRIFRLLKTMEDFGFIEQASDSRYQLGIKAFQLGRLVASRMKLRTIAEPFVKALSEKLNGTVGVAILRERKLVNVLCQEASVSFRLVIIEGKDYPPHFGAAGKLLMAFLSEEQQKNILEFEPLIAHTSRSFMDENRFLEHLKEIRLKGYSFSNEEGVEGIKAAAAPIRDQRGNVVAALHIGMPSVIMNNIEETKDEVCRVARNISIKMGWDEKDN